MSKIRKINLSGYLLLILGLINITSGFIRLHYGVDFLDEAWYVSTIHQFSLGRVPFISEYSVQQFPFIVVLPFYRLFTILNFLQLGSVMIVRYIYFILVSLTSFTLYRTFIKLVPKIVGFILSTILFVDVFVIPSISYNTMGRFLLVMGVALIAQNYFTGENHKISRFRSILAGFILTLCFLSYITLIIPIIVGSIIAIGYLYMQKKNIISLLIVITSSIITTTLFFIIFVIDKTSIHIINFKMVNIFNLYTLDFSSKYYRLLSIGKLFLVPLVVLVIFKIICIIFKRKLATLFLIVIVIILLVPFSYKISLQGQFSIFASILSFFGLIGYPLFYKDIAKEFAILYFLIMVPVALAGITTGLTSANGYTNILVGISPGTILSLLFIYLMLKDLDHGLQYFIVSISISVLIYIVILFNTVYSEPSFESLKFKVENGPYKGLYTTLEKTDFLEQIGKDLNEQKVISKQTLLCYYNFPAGYLFTNLKSDLYSTWITNWWMSKDSIVKMLELYNSKTNNQEEIPDVVVRYLYNNDAYRGVTVGESSMIGFDPLVEYFKIYKENYYVFRKTSEYVIYLKIK
jgi:hypothetical protein